MSRKRLWRLVAALLVALFLATGLAGADQFVGSKNSHIYHYTSCKWAQKIKPGNLRSFASPSEAQRQGYRPCKVCRPPAQ